MDFMNDLGAFLGITSLAGVLSLLLVLYSSIHIDPIRYTLLDYDKKVEYSFKRLIINIVVIIFLLFILFSTLFITNDNKSSFFKIFSGLLFLILAIIAIIAVIWNINRQIGTMRYKFWTKIRIICIREDVIFPLIASWIGIYYSSLSFSYICKQMPKVSMIIVVLGSIIFTPTLIYGFYKKSGIEQNISYYYAYEKKDDNDESHCDKIIHIYENIDGVLLCIYKDCLKVTEEKSNELLEKLRECEEHIKTRVMRESDKKEIVEKIDEVRKYNRHGYIELGDKCVIDFVSKIMEFNDTTPNDESILEELEKCLIEIKEFSSIKLLDISSIKDGKIYPNLDNIEKFNNLM